MACDPKDWEAEAAMLRDALRRIVEIADEDGSQIYIGVGTKLRIKFCAIDALTHRQ